MSDLSLLTLVFLAFIIAQRVSELFISNRNTKALLEKGAKEYGSEHYPVMVLLHLSWIIALVFLGYSQALNYFWLGIFLILQIFRFWTLASLGERWTTRIIVLDEPLVLSGPFKYFRHPNYMIVVAEIFVAPMVLGLWEMAILFSFLNAAMLFVRIKTEERALSHLR